MDEEEYEQPTSGGQPDSQDEDNEEFASNYEEGDGYETGAEDNGEEESQESQEEEVLTPPQAAETPKAPASLQVAPNFTQEEEEYLRELAITDPFQANVLITQRLTERAAQAGASANLEYSRRAAEDPVLYGIFGPRIKSYLDAMTPQQKAHPEAVRSAELRVIYDELQAEGGSLKKLVNRLHSDYNGTERRPTPQRAQSPSERTPAPSVASGGKATPRPNKSNVAARIQQSYGLSDAQMRELQNDERF